MYASFGVMDDRCRMMQSGRVARFVRQLVRTGSFLLLIGCGVERQSAVVPTDPAPAPPPSLVMPAATEIATSLVQTSAPDTVEAGGSTTSPLPLDDPETVTGDKIGDRVDHTRRPPGLEPDGTVDLAKIPAWISVSSNDVVVGYATKADLYSSPDSPSDVRISQPVPVYDNEGSQVGVLDANGFVHDKAQAQSSVHSELGPG